MSSSSSLPVVKSAGVLPYAVNNRGDVSFLLGKEVYAPGWKDSDKWSLFGGKLEHKETAEEGAARECYEETAGTVFMLPEILQKLNNQQYRVQIDVIYKKTRFICYLVQVPYTDYPRMFRNTKSFVQYTGGKIDCIEKNQLKWFSQHDLRNTMQHHQPPQQQMYGRRPVFRRKFTEMMKFFFAANGLQFLTQPPPQTSTQRPHYMCFDVTNNNGGSGDMSSELVSKNSIYLH